MNRGNIRKTLVAAAVLAAVYFAWCLHPFFTGAHLMIDPRIPDEAESAVREVHSEKQFNRREFRWRSFFVYIIHPSRAAHDKLKVNLVAPDEIALEVPGHKPRVFVTKDAAGDWVWADEAFASAKPAERADAGRADPTRVD